MNQNFRPLQSATHLTLVEKNIWGTQLAPVIPINKHKIQTTDPGQMRIAVRTTDAVHLIKVDEITRCHADNNYCTIFYGEGLRVMVAKTLKAVSELLPASGFLRVHNSHTVRLDAIHLVHSDHIVLYNGDNIPLSRMSKKDLLMRLAATVKFL